MLNVIYLKLYKGGDTIKRQDLLSPCLDGQTAMVRVFNAAPGVPSIDAYINDVPRMINIEYKEITNYVSTRTGPRNLKLYTSKGHNLLLEFENLDVIGGQILTYALFENQNNLQYVPIIDDINQNVMPDQTKVRFYNLDATSITLSVSPNINAISRDLASGNGTEYIQIDPGDYRLQIRSTNLINININFKPGRIYTVYIIGSVSPNSLQYAQTNIPQVILAVDGNTIFDTCIWY